MKTVWIGCTAILLAFWAGEVRSAEALSGPAVEVSLEKPFGYFIGDLIEVSYTISLPADRYLNEGSLPVEGGSITSFLELRSRRVLESGNRGARTYRLMMVYQLFSAPEGVLPLEIPPILFSYGPRGQPAAHASSLPPVEVAVSPLTSKGDSFKEGNPWSWISPTRTIARVTGLFLILVSGVLLLLTLSRSSPRAHSPFDRALRRIAREKNAAAALTIFRNALNEKAGKAVFLGNAEDLFMAFPSGRAMKGEVLDLIAISDELSFNPGTAAVDDQLRARVSAVVKRLKRSELWA